MNKQNYLKQIPKVDIVLDEALKTEFFKSAPRPVLLKSIRQVLDELRTKIQNEDENIDENIFSLNLLLKDVESQVNNCLKLNLCNVINATGVVVHTNLGRSILADEVIENIKQISSRYSNLEFDLSKGKRGSRYSCVVDILCQLSGAESALVVNNNAGAVFLSLQTIAKNKEVIISRGELVEIGGSFRMPDVMQNSGAIIKEVGATNRTHFKDYVNAISQETGLILKVHQSNFGMIGFTCAVSLEDLVELGNKNAVPVMEDLGSGSFIDFSQFGLSKEPTIQESVKSGADIVTFSGDKMLGGPQAGIIVGKKYIIEKIMKNPINRALRIDKMTLAALEATLQLYQDREKAMQSIPTLKMLTVPLNILEKKANQLAQQISNIKNNQITVNQRILSSKVGGGALPLQEIPSHCVCVQVKGISASSLQKQLRKSSPPIIGRIEDDMFTMDLRTIQDFEIPLISQVFKNYFFE